MQIIMSIRDQGGFPVWSVQGMRREASDGKNLVRLQNYAKGVNDTLVEISRMQRALTEQARNGQSKQFASFAQLMYAALGEILDEREKECLEEQKSKGVFAKLKEMLAAKKQKSETTK